MTDPNILIRHQVLLHHAGGSRVNLNRLAETLLGRDGKPATLTGVLEGLITEGALSRTGTGRDQTLTRGPRFDQVDAELLQADKTLDADDLKSFVGLKSHRCITLSDPVGPVDAALFGVMETQRRQGVLRLLPQEAADRVRFVEEWNGYVETGALGSRIMNLMRNLARDAINIAVGVDFNVIKEGHLDRIADHLNRTLEAGTFCDEDGLVLPPHTSAYDSRTSEELSVGLEGWQLRLFTTRAQDDYAPRPFMEGESWPDVVHVEFRTGGTLVLMNGRAPNPIVKALHRAHVEEIDLPHDFNGDTGAYSHGVETLQRSGIMSVSLGDVFPHAVLDRAAGRLDLVPFGEVVDAATAQELEQEGDEDFKAGYFVVARDGLDIHEGSLEWLKVGSEDGLVRFMAEHVGMPEEETRVLIATCASGDYPDMFLMRDAPETLHLYLPYGRNVDGFARAMRGAEHGDLLAGGQSSVVTFTREPLEFPGFLVLDVPTVVPEASPDPEPGP
jgi:hypothetical protein